MAAVPGHLYANSQRATVLASDRFTVHTVEHLLFATLLWGHHWVVEMDGPEIPILDGSALPFVEAMKTQVTANDLSFFRVPHVLDIRAGDAFAKITPCTANDVPRYSVQLVYQAEPGNMACTVSPVHRQEIADLAPARTFALASEVGKMKSQGLARGGTLDCALVIGKHGPLNPEGMRLPDEPARHKMLDLFGDLALLGALPWAHIQIVHPGHRLNHAIVRQLSAYRSKVC